jgi:hypothetical protein
MVNTNSNTAQNLPKQIIGIILVSVTLILGVVIFSYLSNIGLTSSGNGVSETVVFDSNTEKLNVPGSSLCEISSVTDLEGNLISPSNYQINNCLITYNP